MKGSLAIENAGGIEFIIRVKEREKRERIQGMPLGKILIVEDEAISALDLQIMLERWGYERPQIATTGDEAIEKSEQERPDVALVDINIDGGMDGIEVAQRLRSEFGIAIIFMTGYGDEDIIARVNTVNPSDILIKPLNVEKLKSALQTVASHISRAGHKCNRE